LPTQAAATAFQTRHWIEAWYATIGRAVGVPLLITATDRRTGELAAMLPLVSRRSHGLNIIEFADDGVSDSNAPILGPAAPSGAGHARALWNAVREALADADLVRLTKMPSEVEGRRNPLALLPSARVSPTTGHVLAIDGAWDGYLASLKGEFRRQVARSWRAFARHDGAMFHRVDDATAAAAMLAMLERRQSERLRGQGAPYRLDEPQVSSFYHRIVAEGVADGRAVLTVLTAGDEVVATLLGLRRGASYVMIRIATGGERWAHCSPGRMVIVQSMQMLHADGVRLFDFSIGDYAYKRRLGARPVARFDLVAALTPRAWPIAAYERAKHVVRQHPGLHALVRTLRGNAPVAP
jgi:CelD/BcsL family acetyltransferase involved in cellulose biosynthesis